MVSTADKSFRWKFNNHRYDAARRGVEFLFTFEEWKAWWLTDDRWSNRGRGPGKYVMARDGDEGPYATWNVRCATWEKNCAEIRKWRRVEGATRMHARRRALGLKPRLAVRGKGHPQSRAVNTPEGQFESGRLAADHFGVTSAAVYWRIKHGKPGWAWAA